MQRSGYLRYCNTIHLFRAAAKELGHGKMQGQIFENRTMTGNCHKVHVYFAKYEIKTPWSFLLKQ